MATAFIDSTANKAKAEYLLQRIAAGTLPEPPPLQGRMNECSQCHEMTMFARYYIPRVSWCCARCWDNWLSAPIWCTTRADQVHRGRFHIVPQCVIDAEAASNSPVASQDAPKTRVFIWGAKKSEEAWTKARKEGEARRGNVMVMPWKMPA